VIHETELRVRFGDLDPYDHLNHAHALTFFESARVEALAALGYGLDRLKEEGVHIVLVEITARFHRPAGLHDLVKVTTEVVSVGRTTSTWRQVMSRGDEVIATLEITAAFTDRNGRPRRAPAGFAAALET
jgi:acyl-CoA thioester hydrolase